MINFETMRQKIFLNFINLIKKECSTIHVINFLLITHQPSCNSVIHGITYNHEKCFIITHQLINKWGHQ